MEACDWMRRTRHLAERLNLVSHIPLDRQSGPRVSKDGFSYLLILDFESTCWKDKREAHPPEIIEFPVVLLDLSSGKIVSEFHQYVMPTEHPRLSAFCTELTGISQQTVNSGVPIGTCLMLFRRWMEEMTKMYKLALPDQTGGGDRHLYTCCTWSDWDLNLCLENECRRKQLKKPEELRNWIDIRAFYKTFYRRRPQGLNGALRDLGLQFEGREHSGIEDARNTARLVWIMVENGCKLDKSGKEATSSSSDDKANQRVIQIPTI